MRKTRLRRQRIVSLIQLFLAIHRIERQIETVQEAARNARDQVQRFLILGQVWLLQARLDVYEREGASRSWWWSGPIKLDSGLRSCEARGLGGGDLRWPENAGFLLGNSSLARFAW